MWPGEDIRRDDIIDGNGQRRKLRGSDRPMSAAPVISNQTGNSVQQGGFRLTLPLVLIAAIILVSAGVLYRVGDEPGFDRAWAAYKKRDYSQAYKGFKIVADEGHMVAQYNLAYMLEKGLGIPRDQVMATNWYRKSALQGYAPAQYNLGVRYGRGRGVARGQKEAVKWYRKAALQGNNRVQNNLGARFARGRGVERNPGEAVKWFRKSAEQGYANAQYNLALAYNMGKGIQKIIQRR